MDILNFLQKWGGPIGASSPLIVAGALFLKEIHFKRYQSSLDEKLSKYESDLQTTRDQLNKIMESEVHAKKKIFDKEFSIYEELWDLITDLEKETHNLLKIFESYERLKCNEQDKTKAKTDFIKYYNNTNYKVRKFAPFIPNDLYDEIGKKLGTFKWTIQTVEVLGNEEEHLEILDKAIKELKSEIDKGIKDYIKSI